MFPTLLDKCFDRKIFGKVIEKLPALEIQSLVNTYPLEEWWLTLLSASV